MRELLLRAIEEQTPVDIFFTIKTNGQNNCMLFYPAFLVIKINENRNTFLGYTQDQRIRPIKQRIITEDNISLICEVAFNE